jgi:SAM-dependent methyltransferase
MAIISATRQVTRRIGRAVVHQLPDPLATRVRKAAGRPASPTSGAPAPPPAPDSKLRIPTAELATITDPESDHAHCPLCGTTAERFEPFGVKAERPDCRCPTCGSLERHRLVWLFLGLHTDFFDGCSTGPGGSPAAPAAARRRMLHIAPEPTMGSRFKKLPTFDYLSGDIEPGRAMVEMDITDIDQPDDTFDVIYASHVLEHIPDDVRAMRELRRVLKPTGWAVLEVPIHGSATREDLSVTDPAERNRLFGQHDHVRMYGRDGEYERRLRLAGFDVTVVPLAQELGPAAARRFRLRPDEDVYLCRPAS